MIYDLQLWITQLSVMDKIACLVTSLIQQLFQLNGYARVWRYASVNLVSYLHFFAFKWQATFQFLHLNFVKEGCLQDVGSHPIFSPLRCRIPFPGFEKFRFCISLSQYKEREIFLLKNLCFALGAKFTEKAFKGVTHLICKFASGPKYEAYYKRRTPIITAEWLFECVKQVFLFYTWLLGIFTPSRSVVGLKIACEHGMLIA